MFFLYILRAPPISPLFPYTTLFRSPVYDHVPAEVGPLDRRQGRRQLDAAVAHLTGVHNGGIERSEEHTSELQSHSDLVCRLLLEKKKVDVRFQCRPGSGADARPRCG